MPHFVLTEYGLQEENVKIEAYGSGLINNTWKVNTNDKQYILQRINHAVFKEPDSIAHNIQQVATYLELHFPHYLFVAPLASCDGQAMIRHSQGYYRLFPFVTGSHSKDVVETPAQAYEAAKQFGRFTRLLNDMDVSQLQTTIPRFHDLSLRYEQFLMALEMGNRERIQQSVSQIEFLQVHRNIVAEYQKIVCNPEFRLRVTHHDTKISNVLFDAADKGICVIDLDTVMPGYFISDVGDMMRTYICPVSEEEKDFDKIEVREEFYEAIAQGYFSEMKDALSETEKNYFFFAGKFMIYMQALRFLSDHLNNDSYYGARYPHHNLIRATNQIVLLHRLMEKEEKLTCLNLARGSEKAL
jgi:Ser/Thr protein kinase RdoA (MazF antagonist)